MTAPGGQPPIHVRTLTDGGQQALSVATELAAFIGAARETLELALYDLRLEPGTAAVVSGAIRDASSRGVAVRVVHNVDHEKPIPVPPPPQNGTGLVEQLGVPAKAIPGVPDLMHHKFVVRDGNAVWSGSTNWTEDSWSREENVIVVVLSEGVAAAFRADFEQLWTSEAVAGSGDVEIRRVPVGDAGVSAWFCPERGPELAHRIAKRIGQARRIVRIASPVITSGPVLGTLAEVTADGRVDVAGVVDATQIHEVYGQWRRNERSRWKLALLGEVFAHGGFTGKHSTPYRPGSVHDYMHAKVTVCDDTAFIGSFNLSHSGEMNAENVLEIESAALSAQLVGFVDQVRGAYPLVEGPN